MIPLSKTGGNSWDLADQAANRAIPLALAQGFLAFDADFLRASVLAGHKFTIPIHFPGSH